MDPVLLFCFTNINSYIHEGDIVYGDINFPILVRMSVIF